MKAINVFKALRKSINNLKYEWKAINKFKAPKGFLWVQCLMELRGC